MTSAATLGPRAVALLALLAGADGPRTTDEILSLARLACPREAAELPAEIAAAFAGAAEVAACGRTAAQQLLERLERLGMVGRVSLDLWRRTT